MLELFAATALSVAAQEAKCPLRLEHAVAFTSNEATELFVAEVTGPCAFDEARLTMTLYSADGEVLHDFEVDTACAMTLSDLTGEARGALARYAPTRAEEMPDLSGLDDYSWTMNSELYARARETGGPLVCANSMPFGGECVWYDASTRQAVSLLYYGS